MKAYIIIFISILFLIIGSVTYMGMSSTMNVLDTGSIEAENKTIKSIRADLSNLYKENEGLESSLSEISGKIDSLYAGINRRDILKDHIFNRAVLGLIFTAIIGLIAGFFLWLGTLKLMVKPINKTAKELQDIFENDWNGFLPLNGSKEIKFLQGKLNDLIQDLQLYRDKVKQVERENLGSFITHKIKNSLTPIHLCAYNLREIIKEDSEASDNINLIISEINKTEKFISQLRGFLYTPNLNKEVINLNNFIQSIVKKYKEVEFTPNRRSFSVTGDPVLLEEVIVNLIQNAIDASKKDGDIVGLSIDNLNYPVIVIKDSGYGIEDDKIDRIFDEYFTTKQKGMGIGLSYVKKILDIHGFNVEVKSTVNIGTEIRIECNG